MEEAAEERKKLALRNKTKKTKTRKKKKRRGTKAGQKTTVAGRDGL
jgi:hypothetical protein